MSRYFWIRCLCAIAFWRCCLEYRLSDCLFSPKLLQTLLTATAHKGVIAIITSIVALSIGTSQGVSHENNAEVPVYPNVLGLQLSAVEQLTMNLGIELLVHLQDASGQKNRILKQIPPADTPIGNVDPEMYVIVANGLVIPDVRKRNVDIVAAELVNLGFSVDISRRPIERIHENQIASTIPEAGERIDPANEAVFLIASSLSSIRIASDLLGQRVSEIGRKYPNLNFIAEIKPRSWSLCWVPSVYDYFVTGSEPPPGDIVPYGSDVKLQWRRVLVRRGYSTCTPEGIPY